MSICTKIVVGVDGSAGALTAVRYAAAESVRTGLPLELLFVLPEPSAVAASMDRLYPLSIAEMRHAGRQILEQAAHVAATRGLAAAPRRTLAEGDPRSVLRSCARDGALVVLGNDRRPLVKRLVTGSLLNAVAGHAEGPVIVVPDSWTPSEPHGRVVVGIARADESSGLLWRAFREAADREARLDVVHAWELRVPYGTSGVDDDALLAWQDDVRKALHPDLAACSRDFPRVQYQVITRNEQPALALADATASADLMIIGRRSQVMGGSHLGSTGRALLQATRCPIEVVAPAGEPVWERDAELERGGTILVARS
jgi:nucleotide-binding universal stress UspA family protein